VLDDAALSAAIAEEMQPKRGLVIADGHHRYETALNYRDEMRAQHPTAPADAAFNYALVTLVSMSDPGLVILPTHRLVRSSMTHTALLTALSSYFDIEYVESRAMLEQGLLNALPQRPHFGLYDGRYALLMLRDTTVMESLAPERTPAWRELDVAVLHKLILEEIMGVNTGHGHTDDAITYLRDVNAGYDAVDGNNANYLFVLNPTRMEQVNACTQAGEKMPQKSTDFYPKMVSGLVAMSLDGEIGD
jgi:uncharacterized protein (DUF1015 family)